jgi:hypothetical protein
VGNSGWTNDQPDSLTLPPGAGPNDPRYVINAAIPPEISVFAYGTEVATTVACVLWYGAAGNYQFQCLARLAPSGRYAVFRGGVAANADLGPYESILWTDTPPFGTLVTGTYEGFFKFIAGCVVTVETGSTLDINGHRISGSENGFNGNIVGPLTTVSAAYIDVTGVTFNFVKEYASTRVCLDGSGAGFATVATNTVAQFGVSLGGVDYDLFNITWNPINEHLAHSGINYVATGLAAGTYTVQLRWKRTAGTGTANIGNDFFSLSARECAT